MSETVTRTIADARSAGQQAAIAGQDYRDNPHRQDDSAKGRVLARMWAAGFASADRIPVDYTG